MNVYAWIFTGLLVVTLVLYIVGLVQRIIPLEKTARSLFVPFTGGIIVSILTNYLPDSHHIIFFAAMAFTTATLCMLSTIKKNKFFKFSEHFLFLITETFWLRLISSVYRIFRVSNILYILTGIVFIAGFVVISVFIKKQSIQKYAAAIIQYFFASIVCTTSLVSLIYEKRAFGILIFLGSLFTICHVIFEIFQRTRPFAISAKLERIIVTILFVTAQALMGTGAILMQV